VKLQKEWTAPIYAFYHATPDIGYEDGRRFHGFRCAARGCKKVVRRFLDKSDARSTGNLRKHAKSCWGEEAVEAAGTVKNATEARESIVKTLRANGSITTAFEVAGKGRVTYSHRPHTKTETKSFIPLSYPRNNIDQS
jgi:hypothetical protein